MNADCNRSPGNGSRLSHNVLLMLQFRSYAISVALFWWQVSIFFVQIDRWSRISQASRTVFPWPLLFTCVQTQPPNSCFFVSARRSNRHLTIFPHPLCWACHVTPKGWHQVQCCFIACSYIYRNSLGPKVYSFVRTEWYLQVYQKKNYKKTKQNPTCILINSGKLSYNYHILDFRWVL